MTPNSISLQRHNLIYFLKKKLLDHNNLFISLDD